MRVERVADVVMNLLLLGDDSGDGPQGPQGQGSGHWVVGVDDGEDSTQKFVDVSDFVL